MQNLGSRLKQLRKSRGWTQKQLADQIHKSAAAIGSYEQDVQTPPTDVLISLAKIYHLSLDELIGFTQDYSFQTDRLTQDQRKIIEVLLDEFLNPTSQGDGLSDNQMRIINQLIRLFLAT